MTTLKKIIYRNIRSRHPSYYKRIRVHGALKACLSTEDISDEEALKLAREWTGIVGQDFVKEVTCKESYTGTHPEKK